VVVPVWCRPKRRQLERGVHAERLADHEALAVIVVDASEVETELRVAAHGPGRVARQDVDLAGLQRGEALLGRQRAELHSGASPKTAAATPRQRSTSIPDQSPASFGRRSRRGPGDAALDESLCLDIIESCGGSSRGSHASNGSDANDSRQNLFVHLIQPFFLLPCFGCDKGGRSHLPGSQPYLLALEHTMPKCAMGQVFDGRKLSNQTIRMIILSLAERRNKSL
jgi:hypothetical protein